LTQLLADSLSGQAKVMMFVHAAPESSSFGETISTLKFGSRVAEITLGQAAKNIERGSPLEVKEAQVRSARGV
jgi:kinesin family member C2/C3